VTRHESVANQVAACFESLIKGVEVISMPVSTRRACSLALVIIESHPNAGVVLTGGYAGQSLLGVSKGGASIRGPY